MTSEERREVAERVRKTQAGCAVSGMKRHDPRRVDGSTLSVLKGDGSRQRLTLTAAETRAALVAVRRERARATAPPADTRKHRLNDRESVTAYLAWRMGDGGAEEVAESMHCTVAAVLGAVERCESGRYGRIL